MCLRDLGSSNALSSAERIADPRRDSNRNRGRGNSSQRDFRNKRSSNHHRSDNFEDRPVHRRHKW